ncbi:hypothetical protein ACEWY4_016062 [Coilia grayii]|uniref:Uncharacterized protein n=1 Tax=Coilia grayii TaxID=363190 RepID=A0ABD1JQT0_9TELE
MFVYFTSFQLDFDSFAEKSEDNFSDRGSPAPPDTKSVYPSPRHQGTRDTTEVSHATPLPARSPPSMNPACSPFQQTSPNISPAYPPFQQHTASPNISPACSPCQRTTPSPNISQACPPSQAAIPAWSPHSVSSNVTLSPPNETSEDIVLNETSIGGVNEASPAHSRADLEDLPDHLESLFKALQNRLPELPVPRSNTVNVVRDDVFGCAERAFKRQRFNPAAPIYVIFIDNDGSVEGAVDQGGPRRKFLRLLMKDIQRSRIFEGPEESRSLALDGAALQDGLYRTIGKMLAVACLSTFFMTDFTVKLVDYHPQNAE